MHTNSKKQTNFFETHKKIVLTISVLFSSFLSIAACELLLQKFMGLGNPVIYDSSPIYGFRPLPNKEYRRFWGARIAFNNLGLRTNTDWDEKKEDKILFLGDSVTYGGSYIDNNDLFSHLAVELLNKTGKFNYTGGNAAVNSWGVENIYGLVRETQFLPAMTYITTLPEGDFYRGLTRIGGHFFNKKPKLALQELWHFFCYKQNNKKYKHWTRFATESEKVYVVEKAVKKLKELDLFLKEKGYKHFIFISPTKRQVLEGANKDMSVYNLMIKHGLTPCYIVDDIGGYNMSDKEKERMFHDLTHLEEKGHEMWAKIIAAKLKSCLLF
ncbi:MAG: SGNH/GDSL hydrolase family protein [Desulfobacteraceae bacterium]|nr:SGNH/GDSL hydrolase family protein [Desulfobacteraceae bacterium]